jgi:hypothetical protein
LSKSWASELSDAIWVFVIEEMGVLQGKEICGLLKLGDLKKAGLRSERKGSYGFNRTRGPSRMTNAESENAAHYELRKIGNKLKGIGHMLEGVGLLESVRLDAEAVYLGIGTIVNEIGERVHEIANELDEDEIRMVGKGRGR